MGPFSSLFVCFSHLHVLSLSLPLSSPPSCTSPPSVVLLSRHFNYFPTCVWACFHFSVPFLALRLSLSLSRPVCTLSPVCKWHNQLWLTRACVCAFCGAFFSIAKFKRRWAYFWYRDERVVCDSSRPHGRTADRGRSDTARISYHDTWSHFNNTGVYHHVVFLHLDTLAGKCFSFWPNCFNSFPIVYIYRH